MTGVVQGNDVLFQLELGNGYVDFICAKDVSINYATEFIETVSIANGQWKKPKPQSISYSVSLSGVIAFDSTKGTAFDLLQYQYQFIPVKFKMIFTDQQSANTRILIGSFYVQSTNLSGNVGQIAGSEFNMVGFGKPEIIECGIEITDVSVVTGLLGHKVTVTVTATETPAYYIYQYDNGFEQTALSSPFEIFGTDGGFHTLKIIPVCAEDKRGIEFTKDFEIYQQAPDSATCPNVSGFTISAIGTDTFTVNYTIPAEGSNVDIYVKNLTTQNEIPYLAQTGSSKVIASLVPGTTYSIRIVTHCSDGTASAGISTSATTTSISANVQMNLNNFHDTAIVTDVLLDGVSVKDNYSSTYGSAPAQPGDTWQVSGLSTGTYNVTVILNGSYTGNITVSTQTENVTAGIDSNLSVSFSSITIGTGGLNISINT